MREVGLQIGRSWMERENRTIENGHLGLERSDFCDFEKPR